MISSLAGAGKTLLFSNIATYLSQESNLPSSKRRLAYFYCDFTQQEFQSANNVLGSLTAQVCAQLNVPDVLKNEFVESHKGGQKRPPTTQALFRTLAQLAQGCTLMLVVDALDECDDRGKVLSFISMLQAEDLAVKVLVTSRNELEIEDALSSSFSRLRLEYQRNEVDRDIKVYVEHRLGTDVRLKYLPAAVKTEIQQSLEEKSAGM